MAQGFDFDRTKIAKLRDLQGLSPERFAELMTLRLREQGVMLERPINGMLIRRWESGKLTPSAVHLGLLTRAFGNTPDVFYSPAN